MVRVPCPSCQRLSVLPSLDACAGERCGRCLAPLAPATREAPVTRPDEGPRPSPPLAARRPSLPPARASLAPSRARSAARPSSPQLPLLSARAVKETVKAIITITLCALLGFVVLPAVLMMGFGMISYLAHVAR